MLTFDTLLKTTEKNRRYIVNYNSLFLLLYKLGFSLATDESPPNDDDITTFAEDLILTEEKTKLDWIIGGICFGIGFLCVLVISYLYRKKIKLVSAIYNSNHVICLHRRNKVSVK